MRSVISFLALTFLLIGCSGSDSFTHRRGKLSDAVNAASDRNSGDRTVNAEFQEPRTEADPSLIGAADETAPIPRYTKFSDTTAALSDTSIRKVQTKKEYLDSIYHNEQNEHLYIQEVPSDNVQPYSFGINAASGFLSSNEFYGITTFGVNLSGEMEQGIFGEIGAEISYAPLQRTSMLSHSIDNGILLLELNLQLRFPTTPEHTFIGQYFLVGGGMNVMLWNYKNAINAPIYNSNGMLTGYETVSSDQLKGIDLFTGIGFDLTQTLPVHLIVEFKPGLIIWTGTTLEGFDNDIFANFAYLQMRLKLNFGN